MWKLIFLKKLIFTKCEKFCTQYNIYDQVFCQKCSEDTANSCLKNSLRVYFSNFDEKSYDLSAYYVPTYKKCIGLRRLKYKKKGNDGYFSMYNTLHSTFRLI